MRILNTIVIVTEQTYLVLAHQIRISAVYILSHIPVPARGKDRKQTATRQPHTGRTSNRDAIVMIKCRHHVASKRIQGFVEVFFHVLVQYKMRYLVVSKKKNILFV